MQPLWNQDIYHEAWDFASQAHKGDTYNGPKEGIRYEYINHLGSVTMEIIWALHFETSVDGNLAIQCALLHDTIEDTDVTHGDLVQHFGQAVADGVLALSKNPDVGDKRQQMEDSLKRIQQQPREIWMVKLADRITNLGPPPWYWQLEKKQRYQGEAELILKSLGSASEVLSERLQSKIDHYDQYF